VHKIAILDLRILNIDRNECNILVQTKLDKKTGKRVKKLVPIDHGLSFPDTLAVCSFDLAWLSWEQAEKPFSRKSLEYIDSIDVIKDIDLIEKTFKFRPICLRNVRISTTLLKCAARAGLTLSQIGQILCRPDDDETVPSLLERIVEKSRLIADLIVQKKEKFKDSHLRYINDEKSMLSTKNSDLGEEGSPNKGRHRTNSSYMGFQSKSMNG
jgi:hypothetical protein